MDWLFVLGIALANNLDNTGVAVAFGLGRIGVPPLVNAWIAVITFVVTAAAVALGVGAALVLPVHAARMLSAVILIGLGVCVTLPAFRKQAAAACSTRNPFEPVTTDSAGPTVCGPRRLDFREGTLLGLVLSLNNLGGGLSAGLLHLSLFWTALSSAVLSFAVLALGVRLGCRLGSGRLAERAPVLAGAVLIGIGLCQLR